MLNELKGSPECSGVTFSIAREHTICLAIKLKPNHYISHNFDCLICQKGSHNVIYTLNAVAAAAAAVVCVLFLFGIFFSVIKILNHQMHLWRSARGREQVTLNACEIRGPKKKKGKDVKEDEKSEKGTARIYGDIKWETKRKKWHKNENKNRAK